MALRPKKKRMSTNIKGTGPMPRQIQPCLPMVDLSPLLLRISEECFAGAYNDATWCFVRQRPLACIVRKWRRIHIHSVLNARNVPEAVFSQILFHELLHLEIPPEERPDGSVLQHPAAFWKAEDARSRWLDEGWTWLYERLELQRRKNVEGVYVKAGISRVGL